MKPFMAIAVQKHDGGKRTFTACWSVPAFPQLSFATKRDAEQFALRITQKEVIVCQSIKSRGAL